MAWSIGCYQGVKHFRNGRDIVSRNAPNELGIVIALNFISTSAIVSHDRKPTFAIGNYRATVADDKSSLTFRISKDEKPIPQPLKTVNVASKHKCWTNFKFIPRNDSDEVC